MLGGLGSVSKVPQLGRIGIPGSGGGNVGALGAERETADTVADPEVYFRLFIHPDVLVAGNSMGARRIGNRQLHRISAWCKISRGRIFQRRRASVAKVPAPARRVAGGLVLEIHHDRRTAGHGIGAEVRRGCLPESNNIQNKSKGRE